MKAEHKKKIIKTINTVFFILALCIFIQSGKNMVTYSKCIDKSADTLLSVSHDTYDFWFYHMVEISDPDCLLHVGILNGKELLGDLAVKNDSVIIGHMKKRIGRTKLLFADVSTKATYYQEISDNAFISLPQGIYHVYFIGSWFSGVCGLNYTNATFTTSGK